MHFILTSSKKNYNPMPTDFYKRVYQHLENLFFDGSLISIRLTQDDHIVSIIKAASLAEVQAGLKNYPRSSHFNWQVEAFIPVGDVYDINDQWKKLSKHPWNIQTTDINLMTKIENLASLQLAL
ncbi:hypothetical protein COU00_04285 [Candidatus Falkowbacteria bacterium CG10_big_fil_rev_8_21_14_0_10_43_11]|uniref:Uncharacterized protein n=1 Tax=Candidatus Falkowbacteria bacterium CG10_big_fil_rev_8_21_14_0_10_43_11 TaxID=1974568 RepID=A0A2M6WKX1_9BACT|nr:MAG: hypothetical protein COU00_04285 [Candidatus Falkowbacteria bacterium CG10_big_fil_rev_8_21_14_0_10_43_11]